MKAILMVIMCAISANICAQKVGLQLYSLRNEFKTEGVDTMFGLIQDWGIEYVEQGNEETYGMPMQEYKQKLAAYGLHMVSVSASYEELRDSPEMVIDQANAFGAKYVVCFWIPHEDTVFTINEVKKAIEVFNNAGAKMQEAGIQLAYHPHGYEFRPHEGELLMDHMIKESDNFKFEMDVYWFAHAKQDPVEWLRRYSDEFVLMHLKDCEKGARYNLNGTSDVETNVALGTGRIDMKAVIEEAIKMNIEYLFIEDESSKVIEQIPQSLEFVKNVK